MSPPTSAEQRAKIEALLADGKIPRKDIGRHVDPPVCYGTVVRIQRNLRKYGTTNKPRQGVVGRPAKITEPMAQAVLEALTEKPEMYLEELARVLHDEFDEWVSVATLSRYLKKEGWVKEKDNESGTQLVSPTSGGRVNRTRETESESPDEGLQDTAEHAPAIVLQPTIVPVSPELQHRLQKLNNSAMRFFSATLTRDPTADLSSLFEKYQTLYPARRRRAQEKSAASTVGMTDSVQRPFQNPPENAPHWQRSNGRPNPPTQAPRLPPVAPPALTAQISAEPPPTAPTGPEAPAASVAPAPEKPAAPLMAFQNPTPPRAPADLPPQELPSEAS